ncbi:MAG: 6-carboxytetrahydropterin synthase [Coxiellaceae bacterium]|nr:6-carboxytetrahydropterin synthase [Coxiellaceae bacterium]
MHIVRNVTLDLGHRLMDERFKCHSIHGHRVEVELHFGFSVQYDIGYCIDFKEIKRIAGEWLDSTLDHGFMANPQDEAVITACQATNTNLYLMSLNGEGEYCNPTAENSAKEIFLAISTLFESNKDLTLYKVRYIETANCWVEAFANSCSEAERQNFMAFRGEELRAYARAKGSIEYDQRNLKKENESCIS